MNLIPAVNIIKRFEGLRLNAYKDPVGIPTIGYGTTKDVKMGQTITREQAEALLYEDIKTIRLPAVQRLVTAPIGNNQLCALISFCYNVGVGALGKSTLLKRLNAGEHKEKVAKEFLKWTKAGGKVLPGLVTRRRSELALFLKPDDIEIKKLS